MAPLLVLVLFSVISNIRPVFCSKVYTRDDYYSQCEDTSKYIEGSVPPVYCAFNNDSSLNTKVISPYAYYLYKQGVEAILVNHPSYGCGRLSAEERICNLREWNKVSKRYGMNIIAYLPSCSYPEIKVEITQLKQLDIYAVMIGADSQNRFNSTYLRVEYTKIFAKKVYPMPIIVDFEEINLRERKNDNVAKFHAKATERIPNYMGVRCATDSVQATIALSGYTRCQAYLDYTSLTYPLMDSSVTGGRSSYLTSIFPGDSNKISDAISARKPSNIAIGLFLKSNKRFYPALEFLNADNYVRSTFAYVELIMREYFICVSNIDLGRSRNPSIYLTLNGLRRRFREFLKKRGITCADDENDDKDDQYVKDDKEDSYNKDDSYKKDDSYNKDDSYEGRR